MIRRAVAGDVAEVAVLFKAVRRACLPFLPDLHDADSDRRFFAERVFPETEMWVAEADGRIVGFCAVRPGWLDHLYVDPAWHGRGIGSALLAKAGAVRLWVFERNLAARAFYARHGFREIERTDGSGNEEREPDVLMERP